MGSFEMIKISELISSGEAILQTGPFGTQLKASDYVEDGIPVINVRNVGFGNIKQNDLEYLDEKMVVKLSIHQLQKGDIVFGRKGAVERHAFINDIGDGWIQGSDCLRLRIQSERINNRFISYFFRTKAHQDWMMALCSFGATMASLNQDIVKLITIPLPPIKVQDKIAAILSAYDDLIENNKRRIALLEKMAEEIYREWFVRFRFPGYQTAEFEKGIPKGWHYEKLENLCEQIQRGISPKYSEESTRLVINQKCIRDERIDLSEARHHDSKVASNKYIRFGDALINSTGVGTLGRVAIVEFHPEKITVDSHVTICRADPRKIDPIYLATTALKLKNYFEFMAAGSTGQVELNRSLIAGIKIIVPPKDLMEEFSKQIVHVFKQKQVLFETNDNLVKTKNMLLPRLISGKLSVEHLDIQFPPSMQDAKSTH
ncbi:Restriction endonuclease S subunit [Crenothrix polyspora]|uniref:Restriction endonuclease S subunit n=1 Tax=Crenothrix polyspora TaxID=360316 RepID=A0A1R4HGQ7_9GAMM|nr:restriction endonuclease subunit S [Crenothrix polyspora]SJM95405.1 Restriction endonuclease S subunit [Crenothrix polyspora]